MDNPIKQIKAEKPTKGKLIVLPFKGTLDDFFKQLNEGTGGMKVDIINLNSIGLRLQEAYDKKMGVKICCLGDLENEQKLKKLKITKEDLAEIYIEGHGIIDDRKGYANVFNGQRVPADEIAIALGKLFTHCGYKKNNEINSKIIIGCCYGAAKKYENEPVILSIAEAIKKELNENLKFQLKPGNLKGTEGSAIEVPSINYEKVLTSRGHT